MKKLTDSGIIILPSIVFINGALAFVSGKSVEGTICLCTLVIIYFMITLWRK